MNKKLKVFSLLVVVNFTYAQNIKIDDQKIQNYLNNLSKPDSEILKSSFVENRNNIENFNSSDKSISENSSKSYDYQVARKLVTKSALRRGALKVGTSFFSAQRLISGVDIDVFDSDVLKSSIPFITKTGIPYLNGEVEYTILDKVGIGGFVGYTRAESENRRSNGVRQNSISQGYILGVQATRYNQASNFFYLPVYVELNYENGKINYFDGVTKEDYNFQRIRFGAGVGATIAVNDRVQFEFRGIDFSYNSVDFSQTKIKQSEGNVGESTRQDQKINRNTIQFGANPRVRFLAQIRTIGREKDKR